MKVLYEYQKTAVKRVRSTWAAGARSVVLVAPTGAGKTAMGVHLANASRVLWVAHRRELINQAHRELVGHVGSEQAVGKIMSGETPRPGARIQVASVDTIRGAHDRIDFKPDLVVLDECHHFMADTYRLLVAAHPKAPLLGLTATPQRSDGRALGDIFQEMVVAAHYSQLLKEGRITPVTVVRPNAYLGTDLPGDPIEAWYSYAQERPTFAFFNRVTEAQDAAKRWNRTNGHLAACIDAHTGKSWRDSEIANFTLGTRQILTSVAALTEGVDVPRASVAMSTRSFVFEGAMLQAFGRVLRACPGKESALILDLTGATHVHGLPLDDREYSLEGRAITKRGSNYNESEERQPYCQNIAETNMEVVSVGMKVPAHFSDLPERKIRPVVRLLSTERQKQIFQKYGARALRSAVDTKARVAK